MSKVKELKVGYFKLSYDEEAISETLHKYLHTRIESLDRLNAAMNAAELPIKFNIDSQHNQSEKSEGYDFVMRGNMIAMGYDICYVDFSYILTNASEYYITEIQVDFQTQ